MNVKSVCDWGNKSAIFQCFHDSHSGSTHFFSPLQKVLSECQDRRSCHIPVFSPVFGQDPCPLTSKYLLVSYKCRPGMLLTCCSYHVDDHTSVAKLIILSNHNCVFFKFKPITANNVLYINVRHFQKDSRVKKNKSPFLTLEIVVWQKQSQLAFFRTSYLHTM